MTSINHQNQNNNNSHSHFHSYLLPLQHPLLDPWEILHPIYAKFRAMDIDVMLVSDRQVENDVFSFVLRGNLISGISKGSQSLSGVLGQLSLKMVVRSKTTMHVVIEKVFVGEQGGITSKGLFRGDLSQGISVPNHLRDDDDESNGTMILSIVPIEFESRMGKGILMEESIKVIYPMEQQWMEKEYDTPTVDGWMNDSMTKGVIIAFGITSQSTQRRVVFPIHQTLDNIIHSLQTLFEHNVLLCCIVKDGKLVYIKNQDILDVLIKYITPGHPLTLFVIQGDKISSHSSQPTMITETQFNQWEDANLDYDNDEDDNDDDQLEDQLDDDIIIDQSGISSSDSVSNNPKKTYIEVINQSTIATHDLAIDFQTARLAINAMMKHWRDLKQSQSQSQSTATKQKPSFANLTEIGLWWTEQIQESLTSRESMSVAAAAGSEDIPQVERVNGQQTTEIMETEEEEDQEAIQTQLFVIDQSDKGLEIEFDQDIDDTMFVWVAKVNPEFEWIKQGHELEDQKLVLSSDEIGQCTLIGLVTLPTEDITEFYGDDSAEDLQDQFWPLSENNIGKVWVVLKQ